jgi:hypothetical protein
VSANNNVLETAIILWFTFIHDKVPLPSTQVTGKTEMLFIFFIVEVQSNECSGGIFTCMIEEDKK